MRSALMAVAVLLLAGCDRVPDAEVATMYRHSTIPPENERVHFATFDTSHGRDFNWLGCTAAVESMNARPDTIKPYWCEQGRFRP